MNASQDRLGEIVAGHRLGRDTLVLLGWSGEGLPEQGVAIAKKRQRGRGRFGAATWTDDAGRRWFLLVIHAPEAGLSEAGDGFQLHGGGAQSPTIAYAPPSIVDADGFAGAMLSHLGARASEAVRFLMDIFPALSGAVAEPIRQLVSAALHAAAEESGVVEIVGRADGDSLLLQGWIRDPHKAEPRLLIDGGQLREHDAVFATFSRSDLAAPALGFVALVRTDTAAAPPRQIYIRSEGRYQRLTVLPAAVHLRDEDVAHHLACLLPNLRTDAAGQAVFRAACRPRFTGQDTVSGLHLPVRMAVDLAARVPGAGWYVTGWLLDPGKAVTAVSLRTAGGLNERLDERWTRLARGDVRDGFATDPLFAGGIAHDLHGFTVFVPQGATGGRGEGAAWIELDLGGTACAFMPVAPTVIERAGDAQRLLASVDLHKAAAAEIIERQLAPLFHARAAAPGQCVAWRTLRASARDGRTALIVPIVDGRTKTNVVVAHLACTTLPDGVRPVFVCSPAAADAARRLSRDLDFYGVDGEVLLAAEPVDACEALEIGVQATRGPLLAFLSPRVHGLGRDWLVALLEAFGDGRDPAAISPTLLYEDGSVRYAGIDSVQFTDSAPYGAAVCARAGYPRGALPQGDGRTLACAIECCVMSRSAFAEVGGFRQGHASDNFKGTDLFLRMAAAGLALRWTAAAELYALDDPHEAADATAQVARLVDGWCFRAAWQNRDAGNADAVIARPQAARARVRAVAG